MCDTKKKSGFKMSGADESPADVSVVCNNGPGGSIMVHSFRSVPVTP